jgi:hypothetical protein
MLDLPLFLFQQNLRRTADALIGQIKTSDVVLSLIDPERIVDRHSHMIVGLTLAYNFKLRASHWSLKYCNTVWNVYLLQCLVGSEHKNLLELISLVQNLQQNLLLVQNMSESAALQRLLLVKDKINQQSLKPSSHIEILNARIYCSASHWSGICYRSCHWSRATPIKSHKTQSPRDLCRAGKGKNYSIYSMSNQDKTDGVFLFLRSNNMYTFNINKGPFFIHNLNFRILPRSSKMK